MNVLVTGGAGYIGSHVVRELTDAGHRPVVLDDLSSGHAEAVPPGVRFLRRDIADADALSAVLPDVQAVVHLAGVLSVGESMRDPGRYHGVNTGKALVLLENASRAGVRRFVFSSTCATYGEPVKVPMGEDHPQAPVNPYGASKLAFERALHDYARAGLVDAVCLRYFNAAGCHPDGTLGEAHEPEEHLIPRAIDAALGRAPGLVVHGDDYETPDGTCIRDYVHVQDLARAHVACLALDLGDRPFRAYNLGTGTGHSVLEVVSAVERATGRPVPRRVGPRRPGDPPRLVASAALAARELSFRPEWRDLGAVVESALRWRLGHADPGQRPA